MGRTFYLRDSFNRNTGAGWAFLFIFQLICSGPLEIASGNIAIAMYLGYLLPGMTPWQVKMAAVSVGVLATILTLPKITSIARLMVALWIGMLITVGWLIVSGLWHFNAGIAFDFPPQAFTFSRGFFLGLSSSTLYVMYCYLGYYGVCYLGDEVKAPARTIPRAIIISILGVLAINFLVSLSIIGVVPWREVMTSPFVASVVMQRVYGNWAGVAMTLLIVWTAFASVYALILTYSRVPFAAAEDGNFFRLFSKLHPSKDFPHYSLLLIGGLSALAGFFDLADVITALLTARILVQFCGQIAALEFLRRFRHDIVRPFRMWLYPLPSAIAFFGWMAIFLNSGARYIAYGMATMLLGVIAYFVMARKGRLWPFQSGSSAVLKILVGLSALSLGACSTQPATTPPAITFQSIPDGEIWFRNSQIQLRFDSEMYCRVYLYKNGSLHSINDIPPDPAKARPPHFIAVNGEELRDFQVDYKNVGASEIRTQFGAGRKLNLTGYAKTSQGVIIEKRLAVELYQDFPDAALVSATYRNTDKAASILVTRSPISFFRMDAARGNAGSPSYEFWIAFGESESGPPTKIDLKYSRSFRSPQDGSMLINLWTSRMGMAVGDLSAGSRELVATVGAAPDQKVELDFQVPGPVELVPNASISMPKSVWLVHTGDARVARERYHELKRRQSGRGA